MHNTKAGRESAQYYDAVKGGFAAYMRYIDLLAMRNGGSDASVGRIPTLAEWYGDFQRTDSVVFPGLARRTLADKAVGKAGVSPQRSGGGCDSSVSGVGEELGGRDDKAVPGVGGEASDSGVTGDAHVGVLPAVVSHGPNWERNRANREKKKLNRKKAMQARADSGVDCRSGESSGGSVHTVDTRTGVEIEAAQTLAARRVAENKMAEAKAKVEMQLAEHRLRALQDKSRTKAVDRLAAARMEEKINKAKKNSEDAFKQCEASLKSLGSTGSAGEFALKQQIKDARDNEAILEYVQEQNKIYARNASPEVLDAVSRVKPPVIQEEYDAFGDCPSDYDEDEAEAYNNDRNRRNDEMAQRLQGLDEAPLW